MTLRAIIFDLDGVLVHTEPIHFHSMQRILEKEGLKLTEQDYFKNYVGLNDREFLKAFLDHHSHPFTDQKLKHWISEKRKGTLSQFKKEIPRVPGSDDFLKNVAQRLPVGLCTGALDEEARMILECLDWEQYFQVVITEKDVIHGKPHPEGYLKVLAGLSKKCKWNPSLKSNECLVIEDTQNGIRAAKSAGMTCVAITTSQSELYLREADLIVDRFEELIPLLLH